MEDPTATAVHDMFELAYASAKAAKEQETGRASELSLLIYHMFAEHPQLQIELGWAARAGYRKANSETKTDKGE